MHSWSQPAFLELYGSDAVLMWKSGKLRAGGWITLSILKLLSLWLWRKNSCIGGPMSESDHVAILRDSQPSSTEGGYERKAVNGGYWWLMSTCNQINWTRKICEPIGETFFRCAGRGALVAKYLTLGTLYLLLVVQQRGMGLQQRRGWPAVHNL